MLLYSDPEDSNVNAKSALKVFLSLIALSGLVSGSAGKQDQLYENPAIGYENAGRNDPVARLRDRLEKGELNLQYSEVDGYLGSVLKLLRIPVTSQVLVFSKTSFQLHRITPRNPRAIYFNDDTYVGWVRGGDFVEISTVDPVLGGVFYMIEQTPNGKPRIIRNNECLQCHSSGTTRNVPGHIVRSVYPDERGYPIAQLGSHVTSQATPFTERFGGWFVTGNTGQQLHLGNQMFSELDRLEALDLKRGANLTSLDKLVNLTGYLSSHSDLVALMVLEHQAQVHNLITRLAYEARIAMAQNQAMNEALGRSKGEISDSTSRRINTAADELTRSLLFVDEVKLSSPIAGTSGFAANFAAEGIKDRKGRSLKDFDLKTRLFKYPCSFLIYSSAIDNLPDLAREAFYRRLLTVLTQFVPGYEKLTKDDRRAVLDILIDTKTNLPEWFRNSGTR